MPDKEEVIELRYDLFSLPTAQHKAGLAGLCVLYESMRKRKMTPLPDVSFPEPGIVQVQLTLKSLSLLFNDLYDAAWEEVESKTKRKDKQTKKEIPSLREETRTEIDKKTGKGKEVKVYIYADVVPKAAFLSSLQMPDPWIKLWRNALWATLRGKPLTRTPYNERAGGSPLNEINEMWKALLKFQKERGRNILTVDELAGSLFLGAQAVNAEKIAFKGRIDENFLLHFWPVVMGVFVPEVIDKDGKSAFKGFVIAIPEVTDLQGFVEEFFGMVARLKKEMKGYRPADAVISLPQEGALEYMHDLLQIAKAKAQQGNISYNLSAIDVIHMEKRGNNIYILSAHRTSINNAIMESYEAIRGKYNHPLFKAQMIGNILHGRPWFAGFDAVFAKHDKDWFLGSKTMFSTDVKRQLDNYKH